MFGSDKLNYKKIDKSVQNLKKINIIKYFFIDFNNNNKFHKRVVSHKWIDLLKENIEIQ